VKERSDGEILAGLIERSRLLIALSDEIPVETKLETLLAVADGEQDLERIEATHALLSSALTDYADLDALLSAMRHFLPR
jgi:hypothetical protein